ncbi:uncharacterized protein Cog3 isoform X2 [Euwallacea fornicatus]|uniref:uncharacterized protein Cog3 isoform X2 n=1 Tax=Euwallacea fornicatus TaxID=995702 RepID=UPI00338E37DD
MYNKLNVSIFLLSFFLPLSQETPFIVDNTLNYCSYPLKGEENKFIETNSTTYTVKANEFQIFFKLCKVFHNSDICPDGLTACLRHFQNEEKIGLGNAFISDWNQLKTINGHKCSKTQNYSLVINFSQEGPENPTLQVTKDKCIFSINMRLRLYSPMCGTHIFGKYIDLSPLARSFKVHTETNNFSVTLCGSDAICNQRDVNACALTRSNMMPISLLSTLKPIYDGSEIGFKGNTYKGTNKKFDKKFTVFLICDWEKNEVRNDDLTYNEVPKQGKKYSFQLKTSYGCLKVHRSCVVKNEFLLYNLTELSAEFHVAWSPKQGSSGESIFLIQMCGAANLKGNNKSCMHAQICEKKNNEEVNRGSVLSQLEVVSDAMVATIDKGAKCYDHNRKVYTYHKTIINFFCDFKDYGPKVAPHPNTPCEIHLNWMTPKACPKFDITSCTYIKEANHSCKFYFDKDYYDLSALTSTKIITDRRRNLEFKFNVCGSVLDSDAPCTKDVSVMRKNLTQPNMKYRFTSLGKYWESSIKNGNLVLQFQTGQYCNGAEGDYRSEVHFECSSIEENPILRKEETCYYEFLWKTPEACPYPVNGNYLENAPCIFTDNIHTKSFNFGNIKPLQFVNDNNITFDICSRSYELCRFDKNECRFVELENITAVFTKDVNKLEIVLDEYCNSSDNFNRFTLIFLCESIISNRHFGEFHISDCSLTITYFTDVVCPSEDESDDNNVTDLKSSKEKISSQFPPLKHAAQVQTTDACSIKSPYTQREINRQDFSKDFRQNCPIAVFNNTFRFVKLTYTTDIKCQSNPSNTCVKHLLLALHCIGPFCNLYVIFCNCSSSFLSDISYEVYLTCSSTLNLPFPNKECHSVSHIHKLEYCDMFKNPKAESSDATNTLFIVGIVLSGVFLVSLLILMLWKRKIFKRRPQTLPFVEIYEKNTEL